VEKIANELHIDFTLEHNELLKGVSRVRSLDIILEIGRGHKKTKNKWLIQKNEEQFSGYGSKRTITWRLSMLHYLKENQPIALGSAAKWAYSGENENQTLF
jgi:beta-phosphoglucomutase